MLIATYMFCIKLLSNDSPSDGWFFLAATEMLFEFVLIGWAL